MFSNTPMRYEDYSIQVDSAINLEDDIALKEFKRRIDTGSAVITFAFVMSNDDIKTFFWSEIRGRARQSYEIAPYFIVADAGSAIRGIAVWTSEDSVRVSSDNELE